MKSDVARYQLKIKTVAGEVSLGAMSGEDRRTDPEAAVAPPAARRGRLVRW
jgi:hypothetical protein